MPIMFMYFYNFLTVSLETMAMIYYLCFLFKSIWVRFISCKEAKVPSKTEKPETYTKDKITEASENKQLVVNCSTM